MVRSIVVVVVVAMMTGLVSGCGSNSRAAMLHKRIVTAESEADRAQALEEFISSLERSDRPEDFVVSVMRVTPVLSTADADRLHYMLAAAESRKDQWDAARATVDARLLECGGPDTRWGFMLRYRDALHAYSAREYDVAAMKFDALFYGEDTVVPSDQRGRIRRQMTAVYASAERFDDVITMAEEARRYTPDDDSRVLDVIEATAHAHMKLQDFAAAEESYDELVARVNFFYGTRKSRASMEYRIRYSGLDQKVAEARDLAQRYGKKAT